MMKALLRINPTIRLLALVLGFCLLWPAARAVGDGDGVDILPYIYDDNNDNNDDDARVDDGHREVRNYFQMYSGFVVAWRTGGTAEHPTLAKQLPIRGGLSGLRDMAAAIATNKGLTGLNFAIYALGVDRHGGMRLFVALVQGGSGKAPVIRCMAALR